MKQILQDARDKIAKAESWQRGFAARDQFGAEVDPREPEACRWCAYGAICAVTGDDYDTRWAAVRKLAVVMGCEWALSPKHQAAGVTHVFLFNDTHEHTEVLAKFDEAINACG